MDEEETKNESLRRAKEVRVEEGVAQERAEEGSCKGGKEADRNVPHDESGPPCLTSARSSLSRPARRYYARPRISPPRDSRPGEIEGDRFIRSLRCCVVKKCNNSGRTDGI